MTTSRPARLSIIAIASIVLTLLAIALGSGTASARPRCPRHWVGVWATSPSNSASGAFVNQSLRLIVNPTFGGRRFRIRLSNRFGGTPVTFGAVTVGRRQSGASVVPHSTRKARFLRQRSVTIPAGGEVVSDRVGLKFAAFEDLAVSLYVSGASGPPTVHSIANQTSYRSPSGSGDHTADEAGTAFTQTIGSWPYLTDIEVKLAGSIGAVVTIGDSITEGFPGDDPNARYSDFLAHRIALAGPTPPVGPAVQNAGISGNQLLRTGPRIFGPPLLDRLALDALDQAGATVVIVMEGTNDLGFDPPATAAEIIAGLQTVVDQIHAAGLRVLLGTQTPSKDVPGHGEPAAIAARNEINDWIRTSGVADGVVDFHAALRDPGDPDQLRPEFDSGDHLHPSSAGYEAMAAAVDLNLITGSACPP
jgi:lysophospholipase L1-like esterase